MTPIYFYIPPHRWPSTFDPLELAPENFSHGAYAWTFLTYYYLNAAGIPCQLVSELPDEGIVIAYRMSFRDDLRPNAKTLLICIKGDEHWHPFSQIHIVQNPQETTIRYRGRGLRYFMPIWIQPGLIPRASARGNIFQNIAYFGRENNFARELRDQAWRDRMNKQGLNLFINSDPNRWRDYSYVDAVLAIRSFNSSRYNWKPPTKLYQAWHAGTPAIMGVESAYRGERKTDLDYIEAASPDAVMSALVQLRDNERFRSQMVENGRMRAKETEVSTSVERWRVFLQGPAMEVYRNWRSMTKIARYQYLTRHYRHYFRVKALRMLNKKVFHHFRRV